MTTATAS
ncbi:ompA family protein, partial [Vibrio parahaemolyticus AQ3810]